MYGVCVGRVRVRVAMCVREGTGKENKVANNAQMLHLGGEFDPYIPKPAGTVPTVRDLGSAVPCPAPCTAARQGERRASASVRTRQSPAGSQGEKVSRGAIRLT